MLSAALLLVVVLAGAALVLGSQAAANASAAEAERQVALAREVAASALNNLATDPERSILLALQAVRISTEDAKPVLVEAEDALHQAVQTSRLRTTLRGHDGGLWSLALSGDGTRLATVSTDGTAKVWDLATNQVRDDPADQCDRQSERHRRGLQPRRQAAADRSAATTPQRCGTLQRAKHCFRCAATPDW